MGRAPAADSAWTWGQWLWWLMPPAGVALLAGVVGYVEAFRAETMIPLAAAVFALMWLGSGSLCGLGAD